jgi:hypothetical protein
MPEQGKKNNDRNRNSEQPQQRAFTQTHDPPPLKEPGQQRATRKQVPGGDERQARGPKVPLIERRTLKTESRDRADYSTK